MKGLFVRFAHAMVIFLLAMQAILTQTVPAQAAFSCTQVIGITPQECDILVAIYNSTGGTNWVNHTNWLVTNTPADWFGVEVANGHVSILSLHDNQLSGSLPTEWSALVELEILSLEANQLTGSIPPDLGSLPILQILNLQSNQLTGGIPAQLGNLTYLVQLRLFENQLTGAIPSQLAVFRTW